ncbi:MAG: hypothetical protein U9O94_06960 [Nanoarchaeota archaeon]|nr:hypothetical protein [Nanoarchaeota archaeon]
MRTRTENCFRMKGAFKLVLILLSICILVISYVYAEKPDPVGPTSITRGADQKFDPSQWAPSQVNSKAGNLTELSLNVTAPTMTWQGYYGNVTGTITLDDANNWTMYSWVSSDPQGEIYASNGSIVTWSKIMCFNYTTDGPDSTLFSANLTTIETMFGLQASDEDGVNETFDVRGLLSDGSTPHPVVYVGEYTIDSGSCPVTDTYQNDSDYGTDFIELLLTDNTSVIFTTIIENRIEGSSGGIQGYNNQTNDFQMIVGDNGHDGDNTVTNYYFFVELE